MIDPAGTAQITVTVNGTPREIQASSTVTSLLTELGLDRSPCAVEVNREVAPKASHGEVTLSGGDVIEIVTLVGGG